MEALRGIVEENLHDAKMEIDSILNGLDVKYADAIRRKKERYGDIFSHLQFVVLKVAMNEDVLNACLLRAFEVVDKLNSLKREKAKKRWRKKLVRIIDRVNSLTPLNLKKKVDPFAFENVETFEDFKSTVKREVEKK